LSSYAREKFGAIATGPESEMSLAEAALWVAAEAYPALDVGQHLATLSDIAADIRREISEIETVRERAAAATRALFRVRGFHGSTEDYYDPRNSFLNEVIERKVGIPITLSILFLEVADISRLQS
jgi:regulator of sirC expression with transglutaminase-like and TPR domain